MSDRDRPPLDGPGEDELRAIVLEGAALLEEANQVVAECKELDAHGAELAHRGHHVASGYLALRNRLTKVTTTDLSQQVEQWLNFEQQIVEQALILGYRPDSPNKQRVAEHFGDPDGNAAHHLRELADRYLMEEQAGDVHQRPSEDVPTAGE